jgi:hypothetical protein
MGYGLPLEFPASSSLEIVGTRLSGVVRRSRPSSLPKGCVDERRAGLDRPHARKARGLTRNKLASTKGDQT